MAAPKELSSYGLVTPQSLRRKKKLIMSVYGRTGVGKSDLMLRTAPRPLFIFDLDRNVTPIIEARPDYQEEVEAGTIMIKIVDMPRKPEQEEDKAVWTEVREIYQKICDKQLAATVGFDTFDATYDLVRRAVLGTVEFGEAPRSAFSGVNSRMKWVFNVARQTRINLCLTCKMEEIFKNVMNEKSGKTMGVGTGKFKMAGWKHTVYESSMVVRMSKVEVDDEDEEEKEDRLDRFHAKIMKCTPNEAVEGTDITGSAIAWARFGTLAYPGSKADWV